MMLLGFNSGVTGLSSLCHLTIWSELTPCNAQFRELAQRVKNGVWEAAGFPVEFPVISLGETLVRPTTMLYRNLASMDVEE
jgi:dihydroxy-acid dehydratase